MAASTTSNPKQFCLEVLNQVETITKKPEIYLSLQNKIAEDLKVLVKSLYDFTKNAEEGVSSNSALPELIIQDFDEEQIWEELELHNDDKSGSLISDVALLVARKERLNFPQLLSEDIDEEEQSEDEIDDAEKSDESETGEQPVKDKKITANRNKSTNCKRRHINTSIVDDTFFKLQDLEKFLSNEDRKEESRTKADNDDESEDEDSEDESIDLFEDAPSDREEEDPHYADFFDAPEGDEDDAGLDDDCDDDGDRDQVASDDDDDEENARMEFGGEDDNAVDASKKGERRERNNKQVRFSLMDENDDDEDDESVEREPQESKSSYATRQERLNARIGKLESAALGEKPWQLKGEVSATARPQNSLLEEVVEFDLTSRPAPIITEQTTLKLEDLIKQRIRDKAWDDVERKVKIVETPQEYKKTLVLNQEKSKQSLAQIYEQEYLKQRDVVAPDGEEKEEEEPETHRAIRVMMAGVFAKLDALSNFHYTPKPVLPEVRVVSNVPAITMEEVAPLATTNATLLAPEEVKAKPKGDVMSKEERTSTDKKRERRHKKLMQRDRKNEKEKREKLVEKLRPGLGNKYSKEKTAKMLEKVVQDKNVTKMTDTTKSVRSSSAFFNQLQEEVSTQIKAKTKGNKKQKLDKLSAKKVKL